MRNWGAGPHSPDSWIREESTSDYDNRHVDHYKRYEKAKKNES